MLAAAPARKGLGDSPQPSTSLDSAQTAQTQQAGSPFLGGSSSNPTRDLLALQDVSQKMLPPAAGSIDPSVAKQAIKEALAPLSPSELAMVQEQLRQSRLARQLEAWGAVTAAPAAAPLQAPEQQDEVNPLVQHVAAALAHGKVSPQDVSRVLNTLDPSVFRPRQQQQQQQQQPQLPAQHLAPQYPAPQPAAWHHTSVSSGGAPMPLSAMGVSPFESSQLAELLPARPAPRHRRTGPPSVAAPYSAVLDSLQLPPAALAAHAAAASAAAAAAALHHPGRSALKGRRSGRRARDHVSSLVLASVSSASDTAGQTSMAASVPQHHLQPAGDMLLPAVRLPCANSHPHARSGSWGSAVAAAADADVLMSAAPAGCDENGAAAAPSAPTSLRARFARLSPGVQADILRQLDELSALEDELRGCGPPEAAEAQGHGPRRSSRARKVRNLDESNSLAAKGAPRSTSPTPPPVGLEGYELEQHHQQGRLAPKRMRLDAGSQHMPGPSSPWVAPSMQQQCQQLGTSSPEAEMPPALDLWVCSPPAEPAYQEGQAPRRRRIPRKAGARASARKRMTRPTFKRGKPQRAPVA